MNIQASADQLRAARVGVDGLLGFFGGNDDTARAATVGASGSVAVRIGASPTEAQALHDMFTLIMVTAEKRAQEADPAGAQAARSMLVLATMGLFAARQTVEHVLLQGLRDTVPN